MSQAFLTVGYFDGGFQFCSSVIVALTGLNLTNHFNALDVHTNTADPQFGIFFGRFDFELIF